MTDRSGIFEGDDPVEIVRRWLQEAEETEPNDPSAISLSTVDAEGRPNVRMVLLKDIEPNGFVFFTNYESVKSAELGATPYAAFCLHWKSLRRQVRVRGAVEREDGPKADNYYDSRSLQSRLGAWASPQSQPIEGRDVLLKRVAEAEEVHGDSPPRPPFWGGFRIVPFEIEIWADGDHRLHDRFRFTRGADSTRWAVTRLAP